MGKIHGSFALPQTRYASQLINDTRFSSIREYVLNSESLSGSMQLDIADLPSNAILYRIELIILSAFSNLNGDQHDIAITCDNGGTIMDSSWNDPNMVGAYSAECHVALRGTSDVVHVIHSLSDMTSGLAILRIHLYTDESERVKMETSDKDDYETPDDGGVDVPDKPDDETNTTSILGDAILGEMVLDDE